MRKSCDGIGRFAIASYQFPDKAICPGCMKFVSARIGERVPKHQRPRIKKPFAYEGRKLVWL